MNAKPTMTITCTARNGLRWMPVAYSAPLPRRDWLDAGTAATVAATVREARRAGWTVDVQGDYPGASTLRAAAV